MTLINLILSDLFVLIYLFYFIKEYYSPNRFIKGFINFYKEIHLYITENDLEEIYNKDELEILAKCGTSLIIFLYSEYLSSENASISNWNAIHEIFDLLIKKEKVNE